MSDVRPIPAARAAFVTTLSNQFICRFAISLLLTVSISTSCGPSPRLYSQLS